MGPPCWARGKLPHLPPPGDPDSCDTPVTHQRHKGLHMGVLEPGGGRICETIHPPVTGCLQCTVPPGQFVSTHSHKHETSHYPFTGGVFILSLHAVRISVHGYSKRRLLCHLHSSAQAHPLSSPCFLVSHLQPPNYIVSQVNSTQGLIIPQQKVSN